MRAVIYARYSSDLGPHMFRDCAATSLALDDPEHVQVIAPLLAHASLRTGEAHYNHAGTMQAVRQHTAMITDKRRTIRRSTTKMGRN